MDTLYHYTSLAGFHGIFSSGSIWASNSLRSNDNKEIMWVIDVMYEHLPHAVEAVEALERIYIEWINSFYKPHICCFSYNDDQLSQWRGYADDGRGIVIGFNPDYFEATREADENRDFIIQEVIYDLGIQRQLVSDFLRSLLDDPDATGIMSSGLREMALAGKLLELGTKLKHPSFIEEQEVRLIHGYGAVAAEPDMFSYRFTNDSMISYIEIPLTHRLDGINPIREIIIGPKCKITEEELQTYIMRQRVWPGGTMIRRSASSYR